MWMVMAAVARLMVRTVLKFMTDENGGDGGCGEGWW